MESAQQGDSAIPGMPVKKVVSFTKNEKGEFMDDRGNTIEKSFVLTMYKMDEKGEIVDDKGNPVESVNVVVEEQPAEEDYVSEEEEEDLSSNEAAADNMEKTALCDDDAAEEIALNKAMERMLKRFGEGALNFENIWQIFLGLLEEENFTKAFEVLLRFGDDFYFLRGCLLTGGQIIPKLHKRVAQRVLKKLCQIRLAGNLDSLCLNFTERGIKNNFLERVDFETNMNTLGALETIGKHFNNVVKDRAEYLKALVSKLMSLN